MRKKDFHKQYAFPPWLVILLVTGAAVFGFFSASDANETPVITGQVELSTPEETDLAIMLTDLIVSDPDNDYPTDFTLLVLEGSNYSTSGNTLTPSPDFNGILEVPVTVNDGLEDSEVFTLYVTVTPVNDGPTDIFLNNSRIAEKQPAGTKVGTFSSVDPDAGQSHVYSLVEGVGSDDNVSFTIADDQLLTAESFDSKIKATYKIRVKTDDLNGGSYEKEFTITVTMRITLAWDANPEEEEVTEYLVYFKADEPGYRNTISYEGQEDLGLFLIEESGSTRSVPSPFLANAAISGTTTVSCELGGLEGNRIYFFVVTARSEKGTSLPSREVATDDTPPSIPNILCSREGTPMILCFCLRKPEV